MSTFEAQMDSIGLGELAPAVARYDRPSLRLRHHSPVGAAPRPVSKLGGLPLLALRTPWPTRRGVPMGFLAQVALDELPGAARFGLPTTGLLSFFVDTADTPWGFKPSDRGGWKVLWHPTVAATRPRSFPPGLSGVHETGMGSVRRGRFAEVPLVADVEMSHAPFLPFDVPPWTYDDLDTEGEPVDYDDDYYEDDRDIEDAYARLVGPVGEEVRHRMFGHADPVDADFLEECGPDAPWLLLLQLDRDREAGMMWCDAGRRYFWIKADDLAHRRWDQVWMTLETT